MVAQRLPHQTLDGNPPRADHPEGKPAATSEMALSKPSAHRPADSWFPEPVGIAKRCMDRMRGRWPAPRKGPRAGRGPFHTANGRKVGHSVNVSGFESGSRQRRAEFCHAEPPACQNSRGMSQIANELGLAAVGYLAEKTCKFVVVGQQAAWIAPRRSGVESPCSKRPARRHADRPAPARQFDVSAAVARVTL